MSEEISIMFNENGEAQIYDSTFDVTIHCENEEEQNKVLEILNRRWIDLSYPTTDEVIAWMPLPERYKDGE